MKLTGIFGLVFGLPFLLSLVYVQTFTVHNPGKLGDLIPMGLFLSLSGYGLIRNDKILQVAALALSLSFLLMAAIAYAKSPAADDLFVRFLIPAVYCSVCYFMGRRQRNSNTPPQGNSQKLVP